MTCYELCGRETLTTATCHVHLYCSCPGVIYLGLQTLGETHRLIADSFALVSSVLKPQSCTPVLEVGDFFYLFIYTELPKKSESPRRFVYL